MRLVLIVALSIPLLTTPAVARDAPKPRETKKYSVGIGYAGSTIEVDTARGGDDRVILNGWGLRARMELKQPWALQFRYLKGMDNFSSGRKLSLDQYGIEASYKLFESEKKYLHVVAKLGLARMDLEERIPLIGVFGDRVLGAAVGVGLEYGPPNYAFFVDFSATFGDVELIPGDRETWTVGNAITGFAYRF